MKVLELFKMRARAVYYRIAKRQDQMISVKARIGSRVELEGRNSIGKYSVLSHSKIGYGTYIGDRSALMGCKVGKFCSIAPDVKRISGTHPISFASTHPAFYSPNHPSGLHFVKEQKFEEYVYAD
ncbi:MAG: hypothetical protein Q4D76_20425, partial [Oscillospiraceae bacterium]|nr:hypothetical protein [Oscillospiraceae bacterium]